MSVVNASVVLGKDVFIHTYDSTQRSLSVVIAGAKSCNISRKCDIIEKASSTQSTSKEYVPGRDEWEMSLNHLVMAGDNITPLDGILKVGQIYALRVTIEGTAKQGNAICTQADLSGAVSSLAQGSIKFKGTGPLADPPSD